MPRKKRPAVVSVDPTEVDKFIALVKQADYSKTTPELRADVIAKMAEDYALHQKMSDAWGKELARQVRARALWTKPVNGVKQGY